MAPPSAVKILVIALPLAAWAQTPTKYPVESIRVTGSKLYAEPAMVAIAGLKLGQMIAAPELEAARDRLLAVGAFTNVNYRYQPGPSKKGYAVTFEVSDQTQLFDYRLERFDVDLAKLRAWIKLKEPLFGARIPGDTAVLARFREAIASYLKSQNKPTEVAGRVASDQGETFVLFSPPGQLPAVATIHFTGNKVISLAALQSTIHSVAVGSQFREQRFRELLDLGIRPLYDARGRLRMTYPKIEAKPSEGVKGLAVTVGIEEGETFSFGSIRVQGIPGGEDAVLKAAGLPEGEVADLQLVTAAQLRIERFLRANGHMAAQIAWDKFLADQTRTCDITFRIEPGPKYTFSKLILQGLDLHGEHEMKRIWALKTGTTYNGEYPDLFINRVKEEQLFDDLQGLRAVVTPDHTARTVDVKLIFNERKPKILQ